jgi:hypothetical protein
MMGNGKSIGENRQTFPAPVCPYAMMVPGTSSNKTNKEEHGNELENKV